MNASIDFIRRIAAKIGAKLFCQHKWVFNREVEDQCLRSGRDHRSEVYVCSLCGANKTEEI